MLVQRIPLDAITGAELDNLYSLMRLDMQVFYGYGAASSYKQGHGIGVADAGHYAMKESASLRGDVTGFRLLLRVIVAEGWNRIEEVAQLEHVIRRGLRLKLSRVSFWD